MPEKSSAPAHPWQRTVRTAVQVALCLAVAAPLIYEAATNRDPAAATGAAGVGLGVAAAVARLMALPAVEDLLRRLAPWLSASDVETKDVVARRDPAGSAVAVAGDACPHENGSPVHVLPAADDRARSVAHG